MSNYKPPAATASFVLHVFQWVIQSPPPHPAAALFLFPPGKLATMVQGFGVASVEEQKRQQSYFVRLGSLSGRLQHRAYQHSLAKLQGFRHRTQDTLSRLQLAIKLVPTRSALLPPVCSLPCPAVQLEALPPFHTSSVSPWILPWQGSTWASLCVLALQLSSHFSHQIESVKQEVGQKLLEGQQKLHQLWVDWSLTQPKGNQVRTACQPEVSPEGARRSPGAPRARN